MFAAWQGHKETVSLLLKSGANPNIISGSIPSNYETTMGYPSTTALAEAIRNHHSEIAYILIKHGVKIDTDSLVFAGREGNIDLLTIMVEKGADINQSSTSAF